MAELTQQELNALSHFYLWVIVVRCLLSALGGLARFDLARVRRAGQVIAARSKMGKRRKPLVLPRVHQMRRGPG